MYIYIYICCMNKSIFIFKNHRCNSSVCGNPCACLVLSDMQGIIGALQTRSIKRAPYVDFDDVAEFKAL